MRGVKPQKKEIQSALEYWVIDKVEQGSSGAEAGRECPLFLAVRTGLIPCSVVGMREGSVRHILSNTSFNLRANFFPHCTFQPL